MHLILFYSISLLLLFSGIDILKISSVILGTTLLPGFLLISTTKNREINFDDIIFGFIVSIGISCFLTLIFIYVNIKDVSYAVYILYFISGLLVVYIYLVKRPSLKIVLQKDEIFLSISFVIITSILSLPLLSDRISISSHGFHHLSLITQIINGILPPENPGLGGEKISYQWGYHAFIGINAVHLNINPLRVMNIFNIISLFLIITIMYRSCMIIGIKKGYSLIAIVALFGLMRSDAIIFFFKGIFVNGVEDTFSFPESFSPVNVLQQWIWGNGAPWFDRRLLFLSKFYNANNMPLGILLCMAYLFVLLRLQKNERRHDYLIICIIILANIILYPPLAMVPLIHYPVWLTIYSFSRKISKEWFITLIKMGIPYVMPILVALPYMFSITGGVNEPVIRIRFWDQSIRNLVTFWLFTPFIFLSLLLFIKNFHVRGMKIIILSGFFVTFFLATFTRLPLWNSTKFTYVLSYFYAIFLMFSLSWLLDKLSINLLRYTPIIVIMLFLSFAPFLTETAYLISPWFKNNEYSFSGKYVIFNTDKERNSAYRWIRENTTPDSLLLLSFVATRNPDKIAQNDIYMFSAITNRNLFIVEDWYTESLPEFRLRLLIRKELFNNPNSKKVEEFFKKLDRPVYLFIEENIDYNYLVDIDNEMAKKIKKFMPVFENDFQKVYELKL